MSTHPAYDPDPQADVPAETSVRRLIDDLIRTAAPRLGKVAVARIAVPLTDAVIALRAEVLAETRLTRPADLDNDKITDLLDQVVTVTELREALLRRGVTNLEPPFSVGEVITTTSRLAHAPADTVLRDSGRDVCVRTDEGWTSIAGFDEAKGDDVVVSLPARVLDLGDPA